jgi:hypothetical protein
MKAYPLVDKREKVVYVLLQTGKPLAVCQRLVSLN